MSARTWRAAGLADPRAEWFSRLTRWSTEAAVPVDFVKCLSADEFRTRLAVGEAFSVLLVGSDAPGVSRSLIEEARSAGAAVVAVEDETGSRPWMELGAAAVLPESFTRDDLIAALAEHACTGAEAESDAGGDGIDETTGWQGHLVCVTGAGGAGSSLLAACLSAGLAADASNRGLVLLADLALDADQAMMHDSRDVIPGLRELLEGFEQGRRGRALLRSVVFEPEGRGYQLLLGLRRHRDWVAVRRASLESALDLLLRAYRYVVADVDPDAEGIADTGSADVEHRNVMARTALRRADLVVAVGTPDTKGVFSLVRTIDTLVGAGIGADRILPVINRLPRRLVHRAAPSAMNSLLQGTEAARVGEPLLVAERRSIERALRDGMAPDKSLTRSVASAVGARLRQAGPAAPSGPGGGAVAGRGARAVRSAA